MLIYLTTIENKADKSKFEKIYLAYRNLMFYVANDILGDARDAEDVVHQAFVKLIDILPQIEEPTCPKTRALVVTITKRVAIDLYRLRQRHPSVSLDTEITLPLRIDEIQHLPQAMAVAEAITQLPSRYREVLLLKYDSGYTEEEISQQLSISPSNVHKTVQRAKAKLQLLLEQEEGGTDT